MATIFDILLFCILVTFALLNDSQTPILTLWATGLGYIIGTSLYYWFFRWRDGKAKT